jgi:hypothetical protein
MDPNEPDLEAAHVRKVEFLRRQRAMDRVRRSWEEQPRAPGGEVGGAGFEQGAREAGEEAQRGAGRMAAGAAKDVARGAIEGPTQAAGGFFDAVKETADAVSDFNTWLEETVGPNPVSEAAGALAEPVGLAIELLPDIEEPVTTTGALVRGASQFLTGFMGSGRIKAIQKLAEAGRAGALSAPFLRGALADMVVFDPSEERLSNLVQQVPALENPVSEFLAASPDDSAAAGRLKTAAEGLGLGAIAEGLVRGLRAMRSGRAVAQQAEPVVKQLVDTTNAQKAKLAQLLGDPAGPALEVRVPDVPAEEAAAAVAAGKGEAREVFINWSRISSPEDVKAVMQEMADAFEPGIKKAQRGVRSWEQTKLSAEQKDAWQILAERRVGEPLNAEQSVAVRELWAQSAARLKGLAQEVVADPQSELNQIAFRRMLGIHAAVQEQVIAARTETARALNSWAIPAGDAVTFSGQMDQLKGLLQSESRSTQEIASGLLRLADAGMEKEATWFTRAVAAGRIGSDMVRQLWYGSLLSGLHTHARNMLSNTAVLGQQLMERKAANLIGRALGREYVANGEATAQTFGMLQGFRDALRMSAKGRQVYAAALAKRAAGDVDGASTLLAENAGEVGGAYKTALTGQTSGAGKVEMPMQGAFDPEKLGLSRTSPVGRVFDWIDTATTAPTRALAVEDEIFKSANARAELNAQAFRQASREVETGVIPPDRFTDRLTTLRNDPDENLRLLSRMSAEVNTFANEPLATKSWKSFKAVGEFPVIGRIVLPFRRTPYNIFAYGFERTLLAPLVRRWREDVFAGGARRDLAMAKFLTGNAVLAVFADMAMKGDITGKGPEHAGESASLRRQGIPANSFRVQIGTERNGDPIYRWFSYRGLEPVGTQIGLAANITEILREKWKDDNPEVDELVIAASMAIANQLTFATFMTGPADFVEMMSDSRRYGENWWERLVGSAVPTGVAQFARSSDPYVRAVEDMGDALRARTPGLSKDLPPLRDLWGRPIKRTAEMGTLYDFVSPIASQRESAEPIDLELERLEFYPEMPQRSVGLDGVKIDLTDRPREYSRYVELAGGALKEEVSGAPVRTQGYESEGMGLMKELNAIVTGKHQSSSLYDALSGGPDGGKASLIDAIIKAHRAAAREQLLVEFPALAAEVEQKKLTKPPRFAE